MWTNAAIFDIWQDGVSGFGWPKHLYSKFLTKSGNTHRSGNGSRCQEISRSHITSCNGMMGQLLLHRPVHVPEVGPETRQVKICFMDCSKWLWHCVLRITKLYKNKNRLFSLDKTIIVSVSTQYCSSKRGLCSVLSGEIAQMVRRLLRILKASFLGLFRT